MRNRFFQDAPSGEPVNPVLGLSIKKEIYSGKSKFQKIEVLDTNEMGRILVLDNFIQLSAKHEFIYHEILVHPAFFYHPKPKRVLIIGGGDGGVLREVVKHRVDTIFLVDIDKKVIEISKKYLPSVSERAFQDRRLEIFIEDASKFVKRYNNFFDIIIDDLTDPTGVSVELWKIKFYKDIARALKKSGIAVFQTAYLEERFAQKNRKNIKKIFPFFKVHKVFVGCFPFDEHTFSFGSKKIDFDKVGFQKIEERYRNLNIKTEYYTPEIHFSSAVFPRYLVEKK